MSLKDTVGFGVYELIDPEKNKENRVVRCPVRIRTSRGGILGLVILLQLLLESADFCIRGGHDVPCDCGAAHGEVVGENERVVVLGGQEVDVVGSAGEWGIAGIGGITKRVGR